MYEISTFRNNLDAIAERLQTRGFELNVAEFRELDAQRRAAISESERLKADKNEAKPGYRQAEEGGRGYGGPSAEGTRNRRPDDRARREGQGTG